MSTLDETPDTAVAERQTGAQTVAPTSASALLFAASILGEASYTPDQELKRSLDATRAHDPEPAYAPEPAPAPVAAPVTAPVAAPVAVPKAPVAESSRPSVVPPARVESRVETAPVAEPVTKGWFARFLDKLFGRG